MTILHFSKMLEKDLDITFGPSAVIQAVKDMRKRGYTLDSVDEKAAIGVCEICGRPVVDGEKYGHDNEGTVECSDCMEEPDEGVPPSTPSGE